MSDRLIIDPNIKHKRNYIILFQLLVLINMCRLILNVFTNVSKLSLGIKISKNVSCNTSVRNEADTTPPPPYCAVIAKNYIFLGLCIINKYLFHIDFLSSLTV